MCCWQPINEHCGALLATSTPERQCLAFGGTTRQKETQQNKHLAVQLRQLRPEVGIQVMHHARHRVKLAVGLRVELAPLQWVEQLARGPLAAAAAAAAGRLQAAWWARCTRGGWIQGVRQAGRGARRERHAPLPPVTGGGGGGAAYSTPAHSQPDAPLLEPARGGWSCWQGWQARREVAWQWAMVGAWATVLKRLPGALLSTCTLYHCCESWCIGPEMVSCRRLNCICKCPHDADRPSAASNSLQ